MRLSLCALAAALMGLSGCGTKGNLKTPAQVEAAERKKAGRAVMTPAQEHPVTPPSGTPREE
jgi:predicted small lipoprotein YifL